MRHFYIFSLGQRSLGFLDSNVCYMIELLTQLIPYLCHTTANWLTLGKWLPSQSKLLMLSPLKAYQPRGIFLSASLTSPSAGVQSGDRSPGLSWLSPSLPSTSPPGSGTESTALTTQVGGPGSQGPAPDTQSLLLQRLARSVLSNSNNGWNTSLLMFTSTSSSGSELSLSSASPAS